jgi:hypothetical protein
MQNRHSEPERTLEGDGDNTTTDKYVNDQSLEDILVGRIQTLEHEVTL